MRDDMGKICTTCNCYKLYQDYAADARAKDGKQSSCRECGRKRCREAKARIAKEAKLIPQSKRCACCKHSKNASEFNKNRSSKDGLHTECRVCVSTSKRELRQDNARSQKQRCLAKTCKYCKRLWDAKYFVKDRTTKDHLSQVCQFCKKKKDKESHARNRETRNLSNRNYNKTYKNPYAAQKREYLRERSLILTYGIDSEEYTNLLLAQNNVCGLCFQPETCLNPAGGVKPLAVDHDHKTDKVRGLLCFQCNTKLGEYESIVNNEEQYNRVLAWIAKGKLSQSIQIKAICV